VGFGEEAKGLADVELFAVRDAILAGELVGGAFFALGGG